MPDDAASSPPSHHLPDGKFRVPWPMEKGDEARGFSQLLRWQWERMGSRRAPNPTADQLPRAEPSIARPRAAPGEIRATWVGHSTFLLQAGGLNLLTDPVFSRRASPFQWAGPARFTPPGIMLGDLPEIDAVLLSHDHYDHLDEATAKRLRDRFGPGLRWVTPLGYRDLLAGWGVEAVTELDWGHTVFLGGEQGNTRVTCLPAQHWTRRRAREFNDRLWASYALALPGGLRIYFAGDSGYFPGYAEIGRAHGPFDLSLVPIGAYEPRWFMKDQHCNPEESVRIFQDLQAKRALGVHWGTFQLTDEALDEPPRALKKALQAEQLSEQDFFVMAIGETRRVPARQA